MLISSSILKNSVERYQNTHLNKENFSNSESIQAGISAAFTSFILVVAIIFFILELLLFFYAIKIAIVCTKGGPERIVHLVLATIFTLPYMLFSIFFSNCSKRVLTGEYTI